jgi:chromosome segregation ATPase
MDDASTEAGPSGRTEDDWRALQEQLDQLRVDLARKDAYALELSAALTRRDREVATLAPALAEAKERLAAQDAELARLRAAVAQAQAQLQEITGRAGYRLLARASDVLERHDRLRRAASGLARRLNAPERAGGRRTPARSVRGEG